MLSYFEGVLEWSCEQMAQKMNINIDKVKKLMKEIAEGVTFFDYKQGRLKFEAHKLEGDTFIQLFKFYSLEKYDKAMRAPMGETGIDDQETLSDMIQRRKQDIKAFIVRLMKHTQRMNLQFIVQVVSQYLKMNVQFEHIAKIIEELIEA